MKSDLGGNFRLQLFHSDWNCAFVCFSPSVRVRTTLTVSPCVRPFVSPLFSHFRVTQPFLISVRLCSSLSFSFGRSSPHYCHVRATLARCPNLYASHLSFERDHTAVAFCLFFFSESSERPIEFDQRFVICAFERDFQDDISRPRLPSLSPLSGEYTSDAF